MSTFVERMIGAASLDVPTYEEVEADTTATAQAVLPMRQGRGCVLHIPLLRLAICSETLERNLVSLVAQLGSADKPSFPLPARAIHDANGTPPSGT